MTTALTVNIWTVLLVVLTLLHFISSWLEREKRIGRIERKLNLLLSRNNIDLNQRSPVSDHVKQLATDPAQKVIEAIKAYRQETGEGLKEAKEVINSLISKQ